MPPADTERQTATLDDELRMLTLDEVASIFGVTRRTIERRIVEGTFPVPVDKTTRRPLVSSYLLGAYLKGE